MKKKIKNFLANLFEYTESKPFEKRMLDYCKLKGIGYNDDFKEGCRAGMFLSMCMHFESKNKKTDKFFHWHGDVLHKSPNAKLTHGSLRAAEGSTTVQGEGAEAAEAASVTEPVKL